MRTTFPEIFKIANTGNNTYESRRAGFLLHLEE
jgi:hypothetical protein